MAGMGTLFGHVARLGRIAWRLRLSSFHPSTALAATIRPIPTIIFKHNFKPRPVLLPFAMAKMPWPGGPLEGRGFPLARKGLSPFPSPEGQSLSDQVPKAHSPKAQGYLLLPRLEGQTLSDQVPKAHSPKAKATSPPQTRRSNVFCPGAKGSLSLHGSRYARYLLVSLPARPCSRPSSRPFDPLAFDPLSVWELP